MAVRFFDRYARYPTLTDAGLTLLSDARGIVASVDAMNARARGMSMGLEPELSVVVRVLFPICAIADVTKEIKNVFPEAPLRLFVEALGVTHQRVLDGTANVGVAATLPTMPSLLLAEHLGGVPIVMVGEAASVDLVQTGGPAYRIV